MCPFLVAVPALTNWAYEEHEEDEEPEEEEGPAAADAKAVKAACEGSQIRVLTMYVVGGGDVILDTP